MRAEYARPYDVDMEHVDVARLGGEKLLIHGEALGGGTRGLYEADLMPGLLGPGLRALAASLELGAHRAARNRYCRCTGRSRIVDASNNSGEPSGADHRAS